MADPSVCLRSATESLCPECLRRIPASYVARGSDVYLEKTCPEHGEFRTVAWSGDGALPLRRSGKGGAEVGAQVSPEGGAGCPFSCGLCPQHEQKTCCALVEVTRRCNLECRVCFAEAGSRHQPDPDLEALADRFRQLREAAGTSCIVQLSGGEPTVRDDLASVVALARREGFTQLQLNTNGLRLAAEPGYARRLRDAGLGWVFLQFDGTEDRIFLALRGRPLFREKLKAVERCREAGLGVVLVPTLVPGVNDDNVGAILRLGLKLAPGVRGVHFQPVSYFGRFPEPQGDLRRLTLPDLLRAIEEQTGGLFRTENFGAAGCESPLCSFHGNFVVMEGGQLRPLTHRTACCSCAEPDGEAAHRAAAAVARRWSAPIGPTPAQPGKGQDELDLFLSRAATHGFSVSAMAFQDAWNVDLERVRECCVHVVSPDSGLVPFCLYNLTSRTGHPLYRRP